MNPMVEVDMKEPLRPRSQTFLKVEELFHKMSAFKSFGVAFCFVLVAISLANLGTGIGANILTRTLISSADSDATYAVLTTPNGVPVSTQQTFVEARVDECGDYENIRNSDSIRFHTSGLELNARVASVVTIPTDQSLCGFFLLIRTHDPLFDVVVADSNTESINKRASDDLVATAMASSPSVESGRRRLLKVSDDADIEPREGLYRKPQGGSAPTKTYAALDAETALKKQTPAVAIMVMSNLLRKTTTCGDAAKQSFIPTVIPGKCVLSDYQLMNIDALMKNDDVSKKITTSLDAFESNPCETPITIRKATSSLTSVVYSECPIQVQLLHHMANTMAPTVPSNAAIDQDAVKRARAMVDSMHDDETAGRQLLLTQRCIQVTYNETDGWEVTVDLGCLVGVIRRWWRYLLQ
jgi:hypothetical protein